MLSLWGVFCAGVCYGSEYFATTDMTWAEFYAGETAETSADLLSAGLDAISTPTTAPAISRFPLLVGASSDAGTTFTGVKAVQVRMSDDVYALLSSDSRYTFSTEEFDEYKDVNSDGSFGAMITESRDASSTATITLASGPSARWGHYVLIIKGADADIGLSGDKIARNYLGALIETSDGQVYGMRHDNNLWSDADNIAFCVSDDYVEPHGKGVQRSWKYTADMEGKTITKVTYMLKGLPDVVISCDVFVKFRTSAAVSADTSSVKAGSSIKFTFTGLPDGVSYNMTGLTLGSGKGSKAIDKALWSYADGTLTLDKSLDSGTYYATFGSDEYSNITTSFDVEGLYRFGTTSMTWAEFYAGELGETSADLLEAGLDAVSSPTARIANTFTQFESESNDIGGRDSLALRQYRSV